jgi:hypothetical protein
MVITTRLKVLSAVAAAVGIFIVATWPEQKPAEVAVAGRADHGDRTAHALVPAASTATAARAVGAGSGSLLQRLAHRVTESKAVEALFRSQSWYVAPPPPPPAPVVVVAPPPPTAPPLPFTAMGSYARPGDAKVYFLTRGDRVFDVHVGDTIDNTYSVDGEANGALLLTFKPLNIQQSLPLGGSQ